MVERGDANGEGSQTRKGHVHGEPGEQYRVAPDPIGVGGEGGVAEATVKRV